MAGEPKDQHASDGIHRAIVAVLREIGAVPKDAENQEQCYPYRSIEAVYKRLHPLLAKHGIYCLPTVLESEEREFTSRKGGVVHQVRLRVRYDFLAEDGSAVSATVEGCGMDAGDKAVSKAMSMAHKYAMCQIFTIPYEIDDPDSDSPQRAAVGVTMRELTDLKRAWLRHQSRIGAGGGSREELAARFKRWVANITGFDLPIDSVKSWEPEQLELLRRSLGLENVAKEA